MNIIVLTSIMHENGTLLSLTYSIFKGYGLSFVSDTNRPFWTVCVRK